MLRNIFRMIDKTDFDGSTKVDSLYGRLMWNSQSLYRCHVLEYQRLRRFFSQNIAEYFMPADNSKRNKNLSKKF